jgi:PD-(D/E)XK endonuclease
MSSALKPRQQGDWGELAAMTWLMSRGAPVYRPVFHSPDVDLIAVVGGHVVRVEVKTSTYPRSDGRWGVTVATHGGNQSWSGLVKYFNPTRCEFLFVLVGDGRQWFIPTAALDCKSSLTLGGPKYSEFEVEPGRPLEAASRIDDLPSGERRSGRAGLDCKSSASIAEWVRIPPPPSPSPRRPPRPGFQPSKYERRLGRSGQAIINQKRRVNIPQKPFFEAGFELGDTVQVRCDGYGRVVLERVELPDWAPSRQHTGSH